MFINGKSSIKIHTYFCYNIIIQQFHVKCNWFQFTKVKDDVNKLPKIAKNCNNRFV